MIQRAQRRRWWPAFVILALLMVVAPVVLMVFRVPVLAWSLRHALAFWDVHIVHIAGIHLETTHLAVDEVIFDMAGQERLSHIKQLRLRYSWRDKQLLSLVADDVQLVLPLPTPPATATGPGASLPPPASQSFAGIVAHLHDFPLQSLRLGHITVGDMAPFSLAWRREESVQYGVLEQDNLRVTADLRDEQGPSLVIRLRGYDGERQLAALQADVSMGANSVLAVAIEGDATAGVVEALGLATVTLDPKAHLAFSLVGELPDDVSLWGRQAAHFDTRLTLRAARLALPGLSLHDNYAQLRGDLTWGEQQLELLLARAGHWRSALIRSESFELRDPRIALVRAAELSWSLAQRSLSFSLPALQVALPAAQLGDTHLATELALTAVRGHVAPAQYQARAALTAANLALSHPQHWLPQLALSSTWQLTPQSLTMRGQLDTDQGRPLLTIEGRHALPSGRGTAELSTGRMLFTGDDAGFGQWFTDWPFAVDVRRGLSNSDVQLEWFPQRGSTLLQGTFQQRWQDMAGVAGDIGFVGVSADLQGSFRYPEQLLIDRGAELSVQQLNVGVPVKDIQLQFGAALRPAALANGPARHKLHLQHFSARLFDGLVHADEHLLLRHRLPARVTFHVAGLDIKTLLETTALEGVAASGRVSGILPLRIDEAGVTMRAGRLAAEAPGGVLRYRGGGGAMVRGSTMAIVQQMLGNYHYDTLSADIDYGATGDLVLKLKLNGANPDVDGGRQIKLNMTVEDNIPTLLRSLQAGRAIEEWVDRRYKKSDH